jgi:Na+-driven multidrug efflux pump
MLSNSVKKFCVLYRHSMDINVFIKALRKEILPKSNWKLYFHFVNIGIHIIFQSISETTVSTVTWLWAGRSATDLSLLQNIHTRYIAHTLSYSIGTTGSIPESGQGTSVTTHLHLLRQLELYLLCPS